MSVEATKMIGISSFLSGVFTVLAEDWFKIGGLAVSISTFIVFLYFKFAELKEKKRHHKAMEKKGG